MMNAEESKKFWGDMRSEEVDHNRDGKWLRGFQPLLSTSGLQNRRK